MKVKSPSGQPFLVDDPLLEPIFSFVAESDKSLLMHIADPLGAWQPLGNSFPHSEWYRAHPEWHMWGREDVPSHARLIESGYDHCSPSQLARYRSSLGQPGA